MRILLVEDEKRLAAALLQLFKEHNYAADVAHDGITGLDLASTNSYDILVLDVMLPGMSGLDIVRQLRAEKLDVPILLLTARDAVSDRVAGLDAGADDYLVKPFANEELLARIRALARRPAALAGTDAISAGPFRIDLGTREATRDGVALNLTAKEFQLLELFIRNQGKVLAKDLILDRVWGPDADVIANAVENYVHFLRKKIDQPGKPSYIETVRGVGYVFKIPE
ncbi:MAG: response regulator transcription factor [Alicyclobacillus herbarius]|uniref:response regulator transcription factor n=1 Tax=Alicyclobacillus herbarius TaxID=122960 RepID=UPI0004047A5E|nr:response regulator transcription factor [Alicyclobacillus herbarius]MCL6631876.1 response regulator transcription factor [Alicyclobacillus herbarius]